MACDQHFNCSGPGDYDNHIKPWLRSQSAAFLIDKIVEHGHKIGTLDFLSCPCALYAAEVEDRLITHDEAYS